MTAMWAMRDTVTGAFSALACAGLIVLLRPTLQRYATAKPTARSSHSRPTPQGGGIAVIIATIAATLLGIFSFRGSSASAVATVFAAAVLMACIGAIDDIHPLRVAPRLIGQALAVAGVIYALPDDLRVVPILPWWIERGLLFVGGLWFVNLVNFMDGIDWMTAAEVVPITAALVTLGYLGVLAREAIIVALALGGAVLGFAYFNKPPAKLFLGDVGSLPIGLLLGWLLVLLAGHGELTAALLLPLYYLADATLTLIHRLLSGERVFKAHRAHYYQRATDRGLTVIEIVTRVFAVNLGLAALAVSSVLARNPGADIALLTCGAALVGWLLFVFATGRR